MGSKKLTAEEWETFLGLADRLDIPVRELLNQDAKFHVLESAGHALGRVVAQAATEQMVFARAERLTEPQPCPTCGQRCPVVHRRRCLQTTDGPIELCEPVCQCSACRRDFFPSASRVGPEPARL